MNRTLSVRCPHCDANIKAPIQLLGQSRSCPGCAKRFVVQRYVPKDAGPILLFNFTAKMAAKKVGVDEPKLILVADDDPILNDGLRSVLEKQGYRVIQAADGVQAKEMIHQEQPDLMILDLMMPRLGGYPVLEYLQSRPEAPPVIMITGEESGKHKLQAESLGAVGFLRKPFGMEKLLESIKKGLEHHPA